MSFTWSHSYAYAHAYVLIGVSLCWIYNTLFVVVAVTSYIYYVCAFDFVDIPSPAIQEETHFQNYFTMENCKADLNNYCSVCRHFKVSKQLRREGCSSVEFQALYLEYFDQPEIFDK